MNIEFILPSKSILVPNYLMRNFKKCVSIYKNTFPILAALSPSNANISISDENVEKIKIKKHIDILGISINTAIANRGYEIAQYYRDYYKKHNKKITIIFGGSHASILPNEALKFGDSVVIGEAEQVWSQLLKDYTNGVLKTLYPITGKPLYIDPEFIPIPKLDLVRKKSFYTIDTLQLSRGCTNNCEFCSINTGHQIRRLSIDKIENLICETSGKYLALLDDNFFCNLKKDSQYISSVLNILKKYKKKWVTQIPLQAVKDRYFIEELKSSGCKAVYIGIESVMGCEKGLLKKNANLNPIRHILNLRQEGIKVMAGFVFGFDNETTEIFDKTLEFTKKTKINLAAFHILTPYPGTRLYERLKREKRLLYPTNWDLYDTAHVVFKPNKMTVNELYNGFHYTIKKFYSLKSIYSRNFGFDPLHLLSNTIYNIGTNKSKTVSNCY